MAWNRDYYLPEIVMTRAWFAAAALVALLCTSATHAGETASKPIIVRMTWGLSLDREGQVVRLETDDHKLESIHPRLEQAIRSWRFTPGKVDGVPAATDSKLQVTLALEPQPDGDYSVRVVGARAGGGYGKIRPPRHPRASLESHRQGLVLLKVRYGADGKVQNLALADIAPRVDAPLVESSIETVREWTFEPEVVGGHPMAGTVLVPICFTVHVRHVAPPDCTWHPPGVATEMQGDQAVALEPAATLLTDVAGRTL